MELANLVGHLMAVSTACGRNYVGTVACINPQNLTVNLANTWSGKDFFDMIIIKATDILYYDFLQQTCVEEKIESFKKVGEKNCTYRKAEKRKSRYVVKKAGNK